MKKARLIRAIIIALPIVFGVYYYSTSDERGFESYVRKLANGVELSKISCSMNGVGESRSRTGFCTFHADQTVFEQFKIALKLKVLLPELELTRPASRGCGLMDLSKQQIALKYISIVNLPPIFPQNSRTSFLGAFY